MELDPRNQERMGAIPVDRGSNGDIARAESALPGNPDEKASIIISGTGWIPGCCPPLPGSASADYAGRESSDSDPLDLTFLLKDEQMLAPLLTPLVFSPHLAPPIEPLPMRLLYGDITAFVIGILEAFKKLLVSPDLILRLIAWKFLRGLPRSPFFRDILAKNLQDKDPRLVRAVRSLLLEKDFPVIDPMTDRYDWEQNLTTLERLKESIKTSDDEKDKAAKDKIRQRLTDLLIARLRFYLRSCAPKEYEDSVPSEFQENLDEIERGIRDAIDKFPKGRMMSENEESELRRQFRNFDRLLEGMGWKTYQGYLLDAWGILSCRLP
jgi:hypothetical protein